MTISEAFEKLDALRVANALNIEYRLVCTWRDNQSIPSFWRTRFVNLMNKHGVEITLRDLAGWIK
jgi:hypothetical protein